MLMSIKLMVGKTFVDVTASVVLLSQFGDMVSRQVDLIVLGVTIAVANLIILIMYRLLKHSVIRFLEWLRSKTPKRFHKHIDDAEKIILKTMKQQKEKIRKETEEAIRNARVDDPDADDD